MDKIRKWEIWGAVISIVVGSLLHFAFDWSGKSHFVALFGAVNESTWEHLKIAFWPTFIFAVIEWFKYGREIKNFFYANFVKLISIPIIIIALFYLWLKFFPDSLIYDILIFMIAIIAGYYMSYKIIQNKKTCGPEIVWAIFIFALLATFSLSTYYPPKTFLHMDPGDGSFGIPQNNQ